MPDPQQQYEPNRKVRIMIVLILLLGSFLHLYSARGVYQEAMQMFAAMIRYYGQYCQEVRSVIF